MQYYCPLNKKIYIPNQKDILYLLTTKSHHLYRFPDLAQKTSFWAVGPSTSQGP